MPHVDHWSTSAGPRTLGAVANGGATPGGVVIPYGGQPAASKRVLDLCLKRSLISKGSSPVVGIDGLSYISSWGRHLFEIPADRPVHLSVHIQRRAQVGTASLVLSPQELATVDYSAPAYLSYPGSMGPRGTTAAKGAVLQGCLGVVIGLALLLPFLVLVVGPAIR